MRPSENAPSPGHPAQVPSAYYPHNNSSTYPSCYSQPVSYAFYQPQPYWPSNLSYSYSSSSTVASNTPIQASSSTSLPRDHGTLNTVTSTVVNTPASQPAQGATTVGRKRTKTNTTAQSRAAKRVRTQDTQDQAAPSSSPAVPGVGPIESTAAGADEPPVPRASLLSSTKAAGSGNERNASDVWYLVRPLDGTDPPEGFVNNAGWTSNEAKECFVEGPPSQERYKSAYVGCRLCT